MISFGVEPYFENHVFLKFWHYILNNGLKGLIVAEVSKVRISKSINTIGIAHHCICWIKLEDYIEMYNNIMWL